MGHLHSFGEPLIQIRLGHKGWTQPRAVTDQVMVVISQVIILSHVVVQRILTEGPEGQEDLQITYHPIKDTVDLQNHVADRQQRSEVH